MLPKNSIIFHVAKPAEAAGRCESLRFKLLGGLVVRRACYGVVRFVMENGAKGCEVPHYTKG